LRLLNQQKRMVVFMQQGRRYDVGDKQGYIEATIEFALKRDDLRPQLIHYLKHFLHEKL